MTTNDTSIRVNIYTPTSTRPALEIPRGHRLRQETIHYEINFDTNTPYNTLLALLSLANGFEGTHDNIERILDRTLHDGELMRDPTVQLDIDERLCRSTDLDHECTVCQNKYKLEERLTCLKMCNHTFHLSCIKEWGKYKQECPLCRKPIPVLER